MNKKNIIIIALSIILLTTGLFLFFTNKSKKVSYVYRTEDLISRQEKMDEKIEQYKNSSTYTIENPKIIINPYEISPLTALIIFKTEENTSVDVYVNNEFLVRMESSINHVIPIYYLKENFENKIKIIANKEEYIYILKTDKIDYNEKINVKTSKINNKYLVSSSTSNLLYSIINSDGDIIWHLDINSQGMIEKLENGNFIIGTEEYVTENNISNITGIYEMNYLGKIIKRIDSKLLYHHDFQVLDDDTLLIAGSNDANHAMSVVYKMSLSTGKIIDYIDFYEVFKNIDPNFDQINLKLDYGFGLNSVDYNKNTDDLLVSMRCLNLVMSIDYSTKEVNWIYADPDNLSDAFLPYLLESSEYVYGMHDAKWIDSNTISLYNNNYNMHDESEKILSNDLKAEALIFDIYNDSIRIKDRYSNENKNSYAFGSYEVNNGKHFVNYSYLFKDNIIENKGSILDYQGNTYTNLVLYDDYHNILFDCIFEDRIYQAKIFEIPVSKKSYETKSYEYINNDNSMKNIDLENTKNYHNILDIYEHYIVANLSEDAYKELIIIFDGNNDYYIKYNKTNTYYEVAEGNYAIYIRLDGIYYDLDTKIRVN